MRKLLLLLLLVLPASMSGAAGDVDMLLTSNGVLHTVESIFTPNTNIQTTSLRALKLTVQRGDVITSTFVPASLAGGSHTAPSLAWDPTDETLYVFWQKNPTLMSSELLVTSFSEVRGWGAVTSINNDAFHQRWNLRVGITRWVQKSAASGETVLERQLAIHAIWWEDSLHGSSARYAMVTINDGKVSAIHRRSLLELAGKPAWQAAIPVSPEFDRDFLRHPSISELPGNESVEIVFGDWSTNRTHRIEVRPVSGNGVLNLPIGRWRGEIPPPGRFIREATSVGRISMITAPGSPNVIIHYPSDRGITYMHYNAGQWGEAVNVGLSGAVSYDGAVNAMRKLLVSQ